jgi:hypothetical protein
MKPRELNDLLLLLGVSAFLAVIGYLFGRENFEQPKTAWGRTLYWVILSFALAWFAVGLDKFWPALGQRSGPGWGGVELIWIVWLVTVSPSAFAIGWFVSMRPRPLRLHVIDLIGIVIGVSVVLAAVVYFRR